jgi:hypothetical protein
MTVLVRILSSPKRDELTGGGGVGGGLEKRNKGDIYGLYCLPNIIRVIKSRTMRLAGHVAHTGDRKDAYRVLILILMCLLTAIGLPPGGSSTVHIYIQTLHGTTPLKTLD